MPLCTVRIKTSIKDGSDEEMVAQVWNPNTWKAEAGLLQVCGQPGLHSESLPQNQNQLNNNNKTEQK